MKVPPDLAPTVVSRQVADDSISVASARHQLGVAYLMGQAALETLNAKTAALTLLSCYVVSNGNMRNRTCGDRVKSQTNSCPLW